MADITRIAAPSLASSAPDHAHQVDQAGHKVAEVDIAAGDILYIKASTGKVNPTSGAAATEAARAWGIAPRSCKAGEPITIYKDVEFEYAAGMTIGTPLYVSATAGLLADAASTGGTTRVAHAVSATRIRFKGDL